MVMSLNGSSEIISIPIKLSFTPLIYAKALAGIAHLVAMSSHKPKGRRLKFWSGHMPRLWVGSSVRVRMRGN